MREYLIAHGLLCLLMATTFAAIGLLSLWAMVFRWPWYVRAAVVLAALSPTLLRPAPELFVTLAIQVVAVVAGVAVHRGRSAVWAVLRGRQKFVWPRIDLRSLLAAMGLMGVLAALLKVAWTATPVETYRDPAALGLIAAATTLLAAWWNAPERTWKGRLLTLILLFPIAGALHYFNLFFNAAPVITFWPYSIENWYGPFPQLVASLCSLGFATAFVLLQVAFVALWRGAWETLGWNGPHQKTRLMATILLTALLVALPVYVLARLQFPAPIPQQLTFAGDDVEYEQLRRLSSRFKQSTIWSELCKDVVDRKKMATLIRRHTSDFQELHNLLSQSIERPLSVEWLASKDLTAVASAFRASLDELKELRTLSYLLWEQADCARREGDVAATYQCGLSFIELARTVYRGVDSSSYFAADNWLQNGHHEIYRALPQLDDQQCEYCIEQLVEMRLQSPPISRLIRYERAHSENANGWLGHLRSILGDLANRIDPTLDPNFEGFFHRMDVRSRITTQLLVTELMLRRFLLRHGSYPQGLVELESLIAAEDSTRLYDDCKPLVYRRTRDGYVLYSPGVDGDDDGGRSSASNSYDKPNTLYGDGDIQLRTHFADSDNENENDS